MNRDLKLSLTLGWLLTAGAIGARGSEAIIRVRTYDYAAVPQATLARAQARASEILSRAGVRIQWAACRPVRNQAFGDATCGTPLTPLDLQMRILDRAMAKRVRTLDGELGYALLSEGFDSIAGLFFHEAVDVALANLADVSTVLGAALAHEIGHLLLEQSNHSRDGILRSAWTKADLRTIAQGRLVFTIPEAAKLVRMVALRGEGLASQPKRIIARVEPLRVSYACERQNEPE